MPGSSPVISFLVGPYMDSYLTFRFAFAVWPGFLPKCDTIFASQSFHMCMYLWYWYGRGSACLSIFVNNFGLHSFLIQQNLASWNPSNPECLLLVVKELVQQYHQFQCSRLRESSRLMFEYQTLLEEPQYGENMEIYAGRKNNWVSY